MNIKCGGYNLNAKFNNYLNLNLYFIFFFVQIQNGLFTIYDASADAVSGTGQWQMFEYTLTYDEYSKNNMQT